MRGVFGFVGSALAFLPWCAVAAPSAPTPAAHHYGLLVGVTTYDQHPDRNLKGPTTDVESMGRMLVDHFGFAPADLVVLKESTDPAIGRPTEANIIHALQDLLTKAGDGDRIVIYLSGHGSMEPKTTPGQEGNPEATTGLFLPCDTGNFDPQLAGVQHALRDEVLADLVKPLLAKGAWVWLVMDSCHSGGLVRGFGEVSRAVQPAELHIPENLLRKAEENEAAKVKKEKPIDEDPPAAIAHVIDSPRFASTYACRRREETPEVSLPYGEHGELRPQGLFTYTLCKTVAGAQGVMTYAELINRVHLKYDADGRDGRPYAVAEGKARDNILLAEEARRSGIHLTKQKTEWRIDAGKFHGLNNGSVLAVYPLAGKPGADKPVGHVRVDAAEMLSARVSPIAFGDLPAPAGEKLDVGAICKPVYWDFGLDVLQVSVDDKLPNHAEVEGILTRLAEASRMVHLAKQGEVSQWTVSLLKTPSGVPTPGLVCRASGATFLQPLDIASEQWLKESLLKIARGQNLLRVASESAEKQGGDDKAKVELVLSVIRKDAKAPLQDVDQIGHGVTLHPGDQVRFRIINKSDPNGGVKADVTLLFLDADYGVRVLYPGSETVGENRIGPGQYRDYPTTINGDTLGTERVVLIASAVGENQRVPTDFGWLEEKGVERAKSRGEGAVDSSLGKLLLYSHFQDGGPTARGMGGSGLSEFTMKVLTWDTSK